MTKSFISAARTLTRIPVPGRGASDESDSLFSFPVVGALVGGIIAVLAWLTGGLAGWPAGAGAICALTSAWITGGLHMDGLGDSVDALYGGQTGERRLEIMKDVHMGAFGVIAITLDVIIRFAAISRLAEQREWLWIAIPFILSRTNLVMLARLLPYARKDGGKAGAIVQNARTAHLAAALGAAALFCCIAAGLYGLAALALSMLIILPLALWMKQTFGGVTGDLLGMANEITECSLLFAAALIVPAL